MAINIWMPMVGFHSRSKSFKSPGDASLILPSTSALYLVLKASKFNWKFSENSLKWKSTFKKNYSEKNLIKWYRWNVLSWLYLDGVGDPPSFILATASLATNF